MGMAMRVFGVIPFPPIECSRDSLGRWGDVTMGLGIGYIKSVVFVRI